MGGSGREGAKEGGSGRVLEHSKVASPLRAVWFGLFSFVRRCVRFVCFCRCPRRAVCCMRACAKDFARYGTGGDEGRKCGT